MASDRAMIMAIVLILALVFIGIIVIFLMKTGIHGERFQCKEWTDIFMYYMAKAIGLGYSCD